jgi:transposase
MKPSSMELRTRVVQADAHHNGPLQQLATPVRVSVSCGRPRLKHDRDTGSVAPKPHGGGSPTTVDGSGLAVVQALVQAAPDAPLRALYPPCEAPPLRPLSLATMSRVLARLQPTRQKTVSRPGTRARRGAAAAGHLPRGAPRAGEESPGVRRRIRQPPSPGQGRWPCPAGAACPRDQAGAPRAPGHQGRGMGAGRGGGGFEGGRLYGRSRLSHRCPGGTGTPTAARAGRGARSPERAQAGRGARGDGSEGGPAPLAAPRLTGLLSQRGMLVQNSGALTDEGRTDAGAPLAGHHGGMCGNHARGCAGLVYTCRLSRSIQLKSAVSTSTGSEP